MFQTPRGVGDAEVRQAMEAFLSDVAEIHGVVMPAIMFGLDMDYHRPGRPSLR